MRFRLECTGRAEAGHSDGGPTCRWPGAPVEAALVTLAAPLTWRVTSTAIKIHGDRRNGFVACPQLGSVGSGNSC